MRVVDFDKLTIKTSKVQDTPVIVDGNKQEILQLLNKELPPVGQFALDPIVGNSKYVQLACKYDYNHYKLLSISDISRLGLSNKLDTYVQKFIARHGACIAIMNTVDGEPISSVFRAIDKKEFLDYSYIRTFYGIDMLDENFQYDTPIILVEGQYDADSLRAIYPNVLAMNTSNVSSYQATILKTLTTKFICAFDNDKAGESGYKSAISKLGNVKRLKPYMNDKDVGVLEETNSIERREYYTTMIQSLLK